MNKARIISLSGKPGSGKSSTADRIAELLGYTRFSAGEMVRKKIKENNITLAEYNAQAAEDPGLDEIVDSKLRELRSSTEIVVDSRLGFHWLPESFKVYLELDLKDAIDRVLKDAEQNASRSVELGVAPEKNAVTKEITNRLTSEQTRFKAIYNVDPYDTSHFDLIINTASEQPQSVALIIIHHYEAWLRTDRWTQIK